MTISTTVTTDHPQWAGRSLAFVRSVKGWGPRFMSAARAREACEVIEGPPKVTGSIVWFVGGHFGDVAIYLGDGNILAVAPNGKPFVCPLSRYSDLRGYLGWSAGNLGDWPVTA